MNWTRRRVTQAQYERVMKKVKESGWESLTYYERRIAEDFLYQNDVKTIKCDRCGREIALLGKSTRTKYCPECAKVVRREQSAARKREQRNRELHKNTPYWELRVRQDLEQQRNDILNAPESDKSYRELGESYNANITLRNMYSEAAKDVYKDLSAVLSKIQATKDSGEPIQMNDLYREKRYYELWDAIQKRIEKLSYGVYTNLSRDIKRAYEDARNVIDEDMREAGIEPIGIKLVNPSAIDASQILYQTWTLDGLSFSDRVWKNRDRLIAKLRRSLTDCIVRGKSVYETAKIMSEEVGNSINNTFRLLRTEVAHAQVMAQTEKYKEYGFTQGMFLASPDCCEKCHEHDGEIFDLDKLEKMLPVHPNCTCTYTLVRSERQSGGE